MQIVDLKDLIVVSTHSRLKAAGSESDKKRLLQMVSTHSRLKAAGRQGKAVIGGRAVSTHSRLKAAGLVLSRTASAGEFQHTAA